jgi:outer membrane murein-binding lipoprotein Lpp
MTAPARVGDSGTPARTTAPRERTPRERTLKAVPDRAAGTRTRSVAAQRAYDRRAHRTQNVRGAAVSTAAARQPAMAPKAPFVVMVMVVLGTGLASIMWLSTQAAADSFKLNQARTEATNLSRQVDQLRRDVAGMESPTELAKQAERLGMVQPGDPARIRVLPDGRVEEFGKPKAAAAPVPPQPPAQQTTPAAQPPADQRVQPPVQQQAAPGGR